MSSRLPSVSMVYSILLEKPRPSRGSSDGRDRRSARRTKATLNGVFAGNDSFQPTGEAMIIGRWPVDEVTGCGDESHKVCWGRIFECENRSHDRAWGPLTGHLALDNIRIIPRLSLASLLDQNNLLHHLSLPLSIVLTPLLTEPVDRRLKHRP